MITLTKTPRPDGTPKRIVMLGDSITAFTWYSKFASNAELALGATSTPGPSVTGPFVRTVRQTGFHSWINSGVAGDDCTNIVSQIPARVTAYAPDIVFTFIGVNCVQHSVSDATCLTNHASINSQILAANPGVQLACMGPLCIQEDYPDGQNPFDTQLAQKNSIVSSTTPAGHTYINLRPAFFAYEVINNPTHLKLLGPLTNNDASGLHPNQGAGAQFLSDTVLPYVTYA